MDDDTLSTHMNSRSDWLASALVPQRNSRCVFSQGLCARASNASGHLNARFRQVPKKFSHQQDIGFLQFVISADKFNLLLTSKRLDSQGVAGDG